MTNKFFQGLLACGVGLALFLTHFGAPAQAQEEVTSPVYRYRGHESSTGYYEEHETTPLPFGPQGQPGLRGRGPLTVAPTAEAVRRRSYLADSHRGLRFYNRLNCEKCHPQEAEGIHTVRAGINCRQCHGGEPIAGINHYYSSMNIIRRHAYVCSKCHEGASASFATYVVHEPSLTSLAARESFPALFYSNWFMVVLLVGTLAFFVPHSILVIVREIFQKREGHGK